MTMIGSPRQTAWAQEIRGEVIADAQASGATDLADALAQVDDAKWWIEIGREGDLDWLARQLSIGLTGPAAEAAAALDQAGIARTLIRVEADSDGAVRIVHAGNWWIANRFGLKVRALAEQVLDALAPAGFRPSGGRELAVNLFIAQSAMEVTK